MGSSKISAKLRGLFFFICVFLTGAAGGIMLTVVLDLGGGLREMLSLPVAREIDIDLLQLKNGQSVKGRILSKDTQAVLVEVDKGTVKFRPDEIERIDQNAASRYFKKAW